MFNYYHFLYTCSQKNPFDAICNRLIIFHARSPHARYGVITHTTERGFEFKILFPGDHPSRRRVYTSLRVHKYIRMGGDARACVDVYIDVWVGRNTDRRNDCTLARIYTSETEASRNPIIKSVNQGLRLGLTLSTWFIVICRNLC